MKKIITRKTLIKLLMAVSFPLLLPLTLITIIVGFFIPKNKDEETMRKEDEEIVENALDDYDNAKMFSSFFIIVSVIGLMMWYGIFRALGISLGYGTPLVLFFLVQVVCHHFLVSNDKN